MTSLWVMIAGAFGAMMRFTFDRLIERRRRTSTTAGIVVVNLLGSFILGCIVGAVTHRAALVTPLSSATSLALTAGLCGGFTTFSTAMADTLRLLRSGHVGLSLFHLFGTFAGAVLVCQIGYALFV